ncbi:MAG TPA: hypothetical protein VEM40_07840 [Nitrospirota bacterium]|nr:hypothetical protein [Nitrospirota bacterium]
MRKDCSIVILLFSTITLFIFGCVSEPGVEKGKFLELNRAVEDLKAAIMSGNACDMPDTLQQRLADGIAAINGKAASKGERDLVAAYSHLLTTYKDGLLLCQSRNLLSDFQFVPRGRIYVSQELDPLVEKYGLSTKRHLYSPTGQYWRSIDGDSIKVIWESAQVQIKNIENMMNYN